MKDWLRDDFPMWMVGLGAGLALQMASQALPAIFPATFGADGAFAERAAP